MRYKDILIGGSMKEGWWRNECIYQIYPRSFMDSDNDGYGDLQGIISKLDYLRELGIRIIWISPFFRSPGIDNGYDISDYRDIDPMFGTMADMEELIAKADAAGISIIMDLVVNHTSDQHQWFIQARKGKDSPYHDYYIWRAEPNALESGFSTSAWTYDSEAGEYYLHLFAPEQPDLNWKNPKVRNEVYDMMNFWIGKGIRGFRMDVIELIGKEPDKMITSNGPKLHEYIKEMRRNTFGPENLFTVGECWGADDSAARAYTAGDELDMVFEFSHLSIDQGSDKWHLKKMHLPSLKRIFAHWQEFYKDNGRYALVWDNHDLPRIVSRYGDDGKYWKESAKMLALTLHMMQGTPFIYQGEEIGMTNYPFASIDEYDDIEGENFYKAALASGWSEKEAMESIRAKGRGNARTPMQWTSGRNGGFSEGKPWLPVNQNKAMINAESQINDPDSIFSFYKRLIAERRDGELSKFIAKGSFELLLPEDEKLFIYKRKLDDRTLTVISNFTSDEVPSPIKAEGRLVLSSYSDGKDGMLRPFEGRAYLS